MNNILQNIFSVTNDDIRKVFTILGIKFKFKSKKLIENKRWQELNNKLDQQTQKYNDVVSEYNKIVDDFNIQFKNISYFVNNDLIIKNSNTRILVVLHLFYMNSWLFIKKHLDNLCFYNYDLIVTCTNGFYDETLDKIKLYKPDTQFYFYDNIGYDIGPFVDVLQKINLDNYDIVYKIHSKGRNRDYIYIYHQIFKKEDWFNNLYNGILGLFSTHKTIDKIINDKDIAYVAAKNLIVKDPKHKQKFVIDIANKININIKENYDFVAGSCWATSAQNLKKLQSLNLSINDFDATKRGDFSFAHAMERISNIILTDVNKQPYGIDIYYNQYKEELVTMEKYNSLRLLEDSSFKIDYNFFYKILEGRPVYDYKIILISLKEIKRIWNDKEYYLQECHPFKYLNGEIEKYKDYCLINKELTGFEMSQNRFDNLIRAFEDNTFDQDYIPIINEDNVIMDGQHRCCYLLKKYGKDHKIKALQLLMKNTK